jgi:type IV fimbrial biogenesis protein FimT
MMPMHMKLSLQRGVPRVAVLQGFTLVELMVTLAVAAVLAMVAVPGMTQLFRSARLSTQTDQLVSALNLARLEAVKRRSTVQVCGPASVTDCADVETADWNNGWVVMVVAANDDEKPEPIRLFDGKTGLTVTGLTVGDAPPISVSFTGTIGSAIAEANFTLCISGQRQQQVGVALSGHVSKRTGAMTCP